MSLLDKEVYMIRIFEYFKSLKKQLEPEVYELKRTESLDHFPGYENVLVEHKILQRIAKNDFPEWKNALSKVKGIYCITDKSTGKVYIGSASCDEEGIWQRWKSYAGVNDLTVGNITFEDFKNRGSDCIIDNFTYSILEVFDMRTDRDYIVRREEHYKRVFQSVKFGMNN